MNIAWSRAPTSAYVRPDTVGSSRKKRSEIIESPVPAEPFRTANRFAPPETVPVIDGIPMFCASTRGWCQFILGARIPYLPDVVRECHDKHPGEQVADALVLTQPWPASSEKARGTGDRVIYYQYRHDRARRTLRGIDEQIAKAQRAVDGKAPVKRNRFIELTGETKSVIRDLEAKARALAGGKGYTTNLTGQLEQFVIGAYHQLWRIEKSFADVQARPAGPAYLSPQTRIDRGPPEHRVRRDGRQSLDRARNRLEHQEIRAHRTPLPQRHDPSRTTDPHRRPTISPKRSPRSATPVHTSLIRVGRLEGDGKLAYFCEMCGDGVLDDSGYLTVENRRWRIFTTGAEPHATQSQSEPVTATPIRSY